MIEQNATFSPEDNKLRLYIGRVPREEYLKLRAEGWKALHKQRESGGGDFVATWTPSRRDTALAYGGGVILDEDQGPAERAADRAERFSGYRDKRTNEATGHADRFDSGPIAHGYQSQARSDRAAAKHDRIADHATDAWSKAEYWQRRTAGVISHALYKSTPAVRMGRIKILEAEQRKEQASRDKNQSQLDAWSKPGLTMEEALLITSNCFTLPRKEGDRPDFNQRPTAYDALTNSHPSLYAPRTLAEVIEVALECYPRWIAANDCWLNHYTLRLAYENQMCEAAGGRAALVEMIPGGFLGSHQILKVNKSAVTGQVVSVSVMAKHNTYKDGERVEVVGPVLFNIERLNADAYRAPTAEELAAFIASRKAEKAAKPKKIKPPLINPTDADAERLQAIINARAKAEFDAGANRWTAEFKPSKVCRITQANYSAVSKGGYARAETRGVHGEGEMAERDSNMYSSRAAAEEKRKGAIICEVRTTGFNPLTIIVLTDKPQKPLPAGVWAKIEAAKNDDSDGKKLAGKSNGLSYTVNG